MESNGESKLNTRQYFNIHTDDVCTKLQHHPGNYCANQEFLTEIIL